MPFRELPSWLTTLAFCCAVTISQSYPSGNQELLPSSLGARSEKTASNEQLHQSSLRIRTSFHNARSSLIRRDNTPEGVQALPDLDSRTSVGGVDATIVRGRGLTQVSALRAGISGRQSVIQSDAWRKIHVQWPGTGPNSVGAQILREEAPIIRVIRTKINEGHEAEHNLTAIRSDILRELSNANGIGIIRRIQIKNRLRELDTRINELRGKNEEAELKLRTFMDGVASGKIHDRRQARSILDNIYHFCGTVVSTLVVICRGLAGALINLKRTIILGLANAIHTILG